MTSQETENSWLELKMRAKMAKQEQIGQLDVVRSSEMTDGDKLIIATWAYSVEFRDGYLKAEDG